MDRISQSSNFLLDSQAQNYPPQRDEETAHAPPSVTPPEGAPDADATDTTSAPSSESVSEYAAATLLESGTNFLDRLPAAEPVPAGGAGSGLLDQNIHINSFGFISSPFNEGGEIGAEVLNSLSNDQLTRTSERMLNILSQQELAKLDGRVVNNCVTEPLINAIALRRSLNETRWPNFNSVGSQPRNGLDAKVLNHLSDAALQELDATVLNGLSDKALGEINATVLNGLSVAVGTQLNAEVLSKLSNPALEQLDERILNGFSDQAFNFSANRVNSLSVNALEKIGVRVLGSERDLRGLQAAVLNQLSDDQLGQINAGALNSLLLEDSLLRQISRLEIRVFNGLSDVALGMLDARLLNKFGPSGEFHARVFSGLSDGELGIVKSELINGLSNAALQGLNVRVFNALSDEEFRWIKVDAFSHLTNEDFKKLDARVFVDRSDQFSMNQAARLNGFTDKDIQRLTPNIFNSLSNKTLGLLEAKVLNGLPGETLKQLDARVLNGLSDETLSRLDAGVLNGLPGYGSVRLAARVLNGLSDKTLEQLEVRVIVRVLNDLSDETLTPLAPRVLNGLPGEALTQLDARVLNGLSNDALTPLDARVLNGLSNDAKKNLSIWPLLLLSDDGFSTLDDSIFSHIEFNNNILDRGQPGTGGGNGLSFSRRMRNGPENEGRVISSGSMASFLNGIDGMKNVSRFAGGAYSATTETASIESSENNFTKMQPSSIADDEAREKAYEEALEAGMTALDSRMSAIAEKLHRLRPDGHSRMDPSSEK